MKRINAGFTLIEILVFIVVSSLLMTVILLSATTALNRSAEPQQHWLAMQTARGCMEWFIEQRRLNGYSSLPCPSTPTASCPIPSGYSVSSSIACTTWNSDTNYKTITVSVSGTASASLSAQIGDY